MLYMCIYCLNENEYFSRLPRQKNCFVVTYSCGISEHCDQVSFLVYLLPLLPSKSGYRLRMLHIWFNSAGDSGQRLG